MPKPAPAGLSPRIEAVLEGLTPEQRSRPNPRRDDAEAAAEGAALYAGTCALCHGPTGLGDGPAAVVLATKARPGNLRANAALLTDAEHFELIARGVPGSSMPPFAGDLSEDQLWALAAHLRASGDPRSPTPAAPPP